MSTCFADSHRKLFCVLFWLFEALLITASITLALIDPRKDSPVSEAANFVFWLAFPGLFAVSFMLRRVVRPLAIIGWWTLFIAFWGLAAMPVL